MIGLLSGTLVDREPDGVVLIDVNGVGYTVTVTGPTLVGLGETGSQVSLRIHTRVREDSFTLFGFPTAAEKRCFEALIGAHGVGPSMALALMSLHSPASLRQIVAMEDAAALSEVPGIGKKTAARLMVELKTRLDVEDTEFVVDVAAPTLPGGGSARADVTAALAGLGYSGEEIRRVVTALPDSGNAQELVRLALRELAAS